MKEKMIAFVFGDLFGMGYVIMGGILNGVGNFGLHILATLFFGIVGGVAGMLGKEYVWPKIKSFFKIKTNG